MSMIFFKQPAALDREKHRKMRLKPAARGYSFAKSVNAVPVTITEMAAASSQYPVVFALNADGTGMPMAILGIRDNENLFVDSEGQWDADYIPGFVRCYPFTLQRTEKDGEAFIAIDEGYDGINEEEGIQLFTEEGKPAPHLQQTISALEQFYRQERASSDFVGMLSQYNLLTSKVLEINAANNTKFKLHGFHVIDEAKINELGDAVLLDLARHGGFGFIYAHLFSLGTMARLIRRLEQRLEMGQAA